MQLRTKKQIQRFLKNALLCWLLAFASGTNAEIYLVTQPPNINMGTWSGAGNMTAIGTFQVCRNQNPKYSVIAVSPLLFVLNRVGGGVITIPFTLTFTYLGDGTSAQLLPNTATVTKFNAHNTQQCTAPNTQVTVNVATAALLAAPAGNYSASVDLDFIPDQGATPVVNPFTISLSTSTNVRVSRLTDLNMTFVDDGAAETATQSFCIYSSQSAVSINILVDPRNNPVSGSGAVLKRVPGGDELPYTLDFSLANGTLIAGNIGAAGVLVSNHTTANQTSDTCLAGASNTHRLTTRVAEAAVKAARSGSYSDIVDITVTAN